MRDKLTILCITIMILFLVSCKKSTIVGEGVEFIGNIRPEFTEKEAIKKINGDIIEDRGGLKLFRIGKNTEAAIILQNSENIQRSCFANCRTLESAIEMYNIDGSDQKKVIKTGDIPERITEYLSRGKIPVCPAGGKYTYDEERGVICSVHGNRDNEEKVKAEAQVGVIAYAWKEMVENEDKLKEIFEKYHEDLYQELISDQVENNLYFMEDKPEYDISFINTVVEKKYKDNKFQGILDGKGSIVSIFDTQKGELIFSCQKEFFRKNDSEDLYFILGYTTNK